MSRSPVTFRVFLHADPRQAELRSDSDVPGPNDLGSIMSTAYHVCQIHGRQLNCIAVDDSIRSTCFSVTFDQVAEALQRLDRLYWEPDGSFVWTGKATFGPPPWQLFGQLQDAGNQLAYVELHGHCRGEQFDAILQALGWPQQAILVQLVQEGVFLDELTFRQAFISNAA